MISYWIKFTHNTYIGDKGNTACEQTHNHETLENTKIRYYKTSYAKSNIIWFDNESTIWTGECMAVEYWCDATYMLRTVDEVGKVYVKNWVG